MLFVENMTNNHNMVKNNKKDIESLKKKCLFNAFKANNRTFCMLFVKNLT
jgi:hypothetical protein